MVHLFLFELRKLMKSTFFRLMMVAFILFFVVYYAVVYLNTQSISKTTELEDKELIGRYVDSNDDLPPSVLKEVENAEIRLAAFEKGDWSSLIETHIERYEIFVEQERMQIQSEYLYSLETTLEQLKKIQAEEIKPVFPIKRPINRDSFRSSEDEEAYFAAMKKYDSSSLYFSKMVSGIFFSIMGAGFFIFLLGDMLTKEGPGLSGSIRFLYTQPIKRNKILICKYLVMVFVSACYLMVASLISFIIGVIFDSVGNGNYPILINGEEATFSFMNISMFLTKSLVLFLFVLLFSYALLFFFSVITKNTLATIVGTIGTIYLGTIISSKQYLSKVIPYLPFNYFSVEKVISQETALALNNFTVNFTNGMITLSISTIIIWIAILILFKFQYGRNR